MIKSDLKPVFFAKAERPFESSAFFAALASDTAGSPRNGFEARHRYGLFASFAFAVATVFNA